MFLRGAAGAASKDEISQSSRSFLAAEPETPKAQLRKQLNFHKYILSPSRITIPWFVHKLTGTYGITLLLTPADSPTLTSARTCFPPISKLKSRFAFIRTKFSSYALLDQTITAHVTTRFVISTDANLTNNCWDWIYCLLIQLYLHARTYGRRVTLIGTHQPTKFVVKFCSENAGQKPIPSVEFIWTQ